ncbi:MAG: redoxin domain-containing protein [Nanoarchaeota archaeon]
MVDVGDQAPDFSSEDADGNLISLGQQLGEGKIFLYFYPMAFSPTCKDQLAEFTKRKDEIPAKIIAISADLRYAVAAFRDKLNTSITLLSDPVHHAIEMYAGIFKDKGISNRAYFIVDETGMITFKKVMGDPGEKMDVEEIIRELNK